MIAGAKAALYGYRLQAMYSIWRILCTNDARTFRPEGNEDLEVLDATGNVLESIQVKARAENLTLSDLEPDKPDSFFRRAARTAASEPLATVRIVSFGPFGPELWKAFLHDGAERKTIANKLKGHGYTASDVSLLFSRVTLVREDETSMTSAVIDVLRTGLMGGDPNHALDLLTYWIFRQAENGEAITQASLQQKVQSVGRYLAERAAHHTEWFTSIIPIDEEPIGRGELAELTREFLSGVAARYEHILAGLDVSRVALLERIDRTFETHRLIVIHGASGQGKSTLAYRYLHNYVPDGWRFQVLAVTDRRHALSIARALTGHLSQFDAPMHVYVDVSFRDRDWTTLVRALIQHPLVRVLVTIREEDWRRASISVDNVPFDEFELALDEAEAAALFANLRNIRSAASFPTFEDAWTTFGGGPLMEFVYLVTANTTLEARLRQQIQRHSDDVRTQGIAPQELDVLRTVSVASAYEARIDLRRLVEELRLPEPLRTIALFEKEYLLRRSADGAHLTGLHPVRSTIVAGIMTDPVMRPWHAVACQSIKMMVEDDLEVFLLYAFRRRREDSQAVRVWLHGWRPQTWTGHSGVWRTLLWSGLEDYVEENIGLIEEIWAEFSRAWHIIIDFDIAGILPPNHLESSGLYPHAALDKFRGYRARQTPKRRAFADAIHWMTETSRPPSPPTSDADWAGVGELLFWSVRLGIEWSLMPELEALLTDQLAESLPLAPLAAFLVGYAVAFPAAWSAWLAKHRSGLYERFRRDTSTVKLEDDGEKMCAHFIVDGLSETQAAEQKHLNGLNGEVMWRVELMRWLFPDRKRYGGQGYGHQLGHLAMPFDDTTKNIEAGSFYPDFVVRVNSVFRNLGNWRFRPADWAEYVSRVMKTRESFVLDIEGLVRFVGDYLAGHADEQIAPKLRSVSVGDRWQPLYPKCLVDEWGFVSEDMPPNSTSQNRSEALLVSKYATYARSTKDAFGAAGNFVGQIPQSLELNRYVGQAATPEIRMKLQEAGDRLGVKHLPPLALQNFTKVWKTWPAFQSEFARRFVFLCDQDGLTALDGREREAFKIFWPLLYYMVHEPSCRFRRPLEETARIISNDRERLEASLRRRLGQLSEPGVSASVLDAGTGIEGDSVLWLRYDTASPVARTRGLGAVLKAVHEMLESLRSSSLHWNVINAHWDRIHVLHLVGGKMLVREAWRFDTVILAMTKPSELEWYSLAPIAVAPNVLARWGIAVWDDQRFVPALELLPSVFELWALVAKKHGPMAIAGKDDLGAEILQQHLDGRSDNLSAAYGRVQAILHTMGEYLASLGDEERNQRSDIMIAAQQLCIVNEKMRPRDGVDGEVFVHESEFGAWEKRLEEAKEAATVAQIYWMADVIKELSRSRRSGRRRRGETT